MTIENIAQRFIMCYFNLAVEIRYKVGVVPYSCTLYPLWVEAFSEFVKTSLYSSIQLYLAPVLYCLQSSLP